MNSSSPVEARRLRSALLAACAGVALWSGAARAQAAAVPAAQAAPATDEEWRQAFQAIRQLREAGNAARAEPIARRALAAATAGGNPAILLDAHVELGLTLQALRRLDEAEAELKSAVEIAVREAGPDHAAALAPTLLLGNLQLGRGRFALAEPLYRRVLEISERALGADHERTISLQNDVALIYAQAGRNDEAAALLQRARAAAERAPGEQDALLLRTLDNIGGLHQRTGNLTEAERVLKDVLARRTRAGGADDEATLFTANNLATLYLNTGRLADAETLAAATLQQAERALGADADTTVTAAALMGQVRAAQGRYAEAEPLLRRALAAHERKGTGSPDWIEAANLLGRTLAEQGRYRDAEAIYRRALSASTQSLGPAHEFTLTTANGLGFALTFQGKYPEAEKLFQGALAGLERSAGAGSTIALQTLSNLATAYRLQGRFGEAEPLLLRAIETGERSLGADDPDVLLLVSNLAELFVKQGRIDEAVALAERALAGAEKRLGPDSPRTLLFANNVGAFLMEQRRAAEAEPYLRRALAGRERIFGWENRDTLLTAGTVATALYQNGKRDEAEALMKRVLGGSERALGATHPETIGYRLYLANQYQRAGRIAEAEPLYARILADGKGRLPDTDDTLIQAAAGLSVTRQVDGLLSGRRRGDSLTPARQMAAAIRARRDDRGGRLGAAQAARELLSRGDNFLLLADALWDNSPSPAESSEAFAALQDSVAGTTDRAVMQMAIRRFADNEGAGLGALVREREELEARWTAASRRQVEFLTAPGVTEEERAAVRAELAQAEGRLDAVDARLRRDFPDYFDLVNPRAITLDNAASVLGPDEALLMVVPGFRGTHLMAVTDAGLSWSVSEWDREKVDAAVRRLLWQLGGNVTPTPQEQAAWSREPAGAFDRNAAHALYNQLIAPMNNVLAGKRHVFVAASGSLSSLPFGVLVTQAPQGSDADPNALRSTRWLADAHALVQVPSVQSLLLLRRAAGGGKAGNGFLGFGDPVLEGGAQARGGPGSATRGARPGRPVFSGRLTRSGTPIADVGALRSMARLPGTAVELRNMREALAAPPNSIFLGPQATESQFRSMDLSNVSILALATHGLVAGEVDGAGEPGLVFTPPAQPSERDDGFLTASEVASLRLNADWVILSACNTASGDGSEGAPGLSGLARAFFYAGARAMLASHWPVRDDVGAQLTVRTVKLRRDQPSLSRAEAFQRAMREIRDNEAHDAGGATWAHPSAWAPFTLVGDAR